MSLATVFVRHPQCICFSQTMRVVSANHSGYGQKSVALILFTIESCKRTDLLMYMSSGE
ncbi:hypothetical protein PIIN_10759 [Serendipita indica DSM 11827]|uniref:Uncharacterized protein n=1 Tax=Serendipita indica (strain DSM 11827) TaxID=1109443 RepID=G4TZM9_SERID|nr:hypothetical protein PIIN_10759 [Serendipita indica DSM 11827]